MRNLQRFSLQSSTRTCYALRACIVAALGEDPADLVFAPTG